MLDCRVFPVQKGFSIAQVHLWLQIVEDIELESDRPICLSAPHTRTRTATQPMLSLFKGRAG
jgi:hypothetical protein